MTIVTWIAVAAAALMALFALFVRWHRNWLAQQTPTGSWTSNDGPSSIKLVFEGGTHEGLYKQVVDSDGNPIREFGHWSAYLNTLNLLIMATDVDDHERFGVDSSYRINYIGHDRINIEGPGRPNLLFTRADDIDIEFDPDETPDSPINPGSASMFFCAKRCPTDFVCEPNNASISLACPDLDSSLRFGQ